MAVLNDGGQKSVTRVQDERSREEGNERPNPVAMTGRCRSLDIVGALSDSWADTDEADEKRHADSNSQNQTNQA